VAKERFHRRQIRPIVRAKFYSVDRQIALDYADFHSERSNSFLHLTDFVKIWSGVADNNLIDTALSGEG
jgi:hypothetical protein